MLLHKRLLATVALPLLSLTLAFQPANAFTLRAPLVIEQSQPVTLVAMSLEEAKARLRAAKQALAQAKANGGDVDAAKAEVQAARAEMQAAAAENGAQDQAGEPQDPKPKKRKKQQQADTQGNEPATDQGEVPVKPKKRKQAQQTEPQAEPQDPATQPIMQGEPDPNGQGAQEPAPVKKKKQQAAQQGMDDQQLPADATPRVKKNKQVAKDSAQTTDTIELPVQNGAAVLDSDKDADRTGNADTRAKRKKLREERKAAKAPKSDAEAQVRSQDIKITPVFVEKGTRIDRKPGFQQPAGKAVKNGDDIRIIFNIDNRVVVRGDDRDRLANNATKVVYEQLANGRTRQVVTKADGTKIVTVRNRFGEIIRRSRIDRRDVEIIIFFSPELDRGGEQLYVRDPGVRLPPMRLSVPVEDYIIDSSSNRDYGEFLAEPPVEQVERVYSIDEVKYSARIRDKVRRIDLDTITFATGSAEISMDQASSLRKVAKAINQVLENDPGETFLIEGHTDAVGSDESNLVLSDLRAESVASVLSELFNIPAENLTTQGYGERFLKVDTDEGERRNRRVTIRRITPLVRPVQ